MGCVEEDEVDNYGRRRAINLLLQNGRISTTDFSADDSDDEQDPDELEFGWWVEMDFRTVPSPSEARQDIHRLVQRVNNNQLMVSPDDDDEDLDCSIVRLVALYLLIGAQPSSIRYARIKYECWNDDNPYGNEEAVVQFKTSDDQDIELYYYNNWRHGGLHCT
jgi:hypothetical protein